MQLHDIETTIQSNSQIANQTLLEQFIANRRALLHDYPYAEQRNEDRFEIVMPVRITLEDERTRGGVTRDISRSGLGVVTPFKVVPSQIANIQLSTQEGAVAELLAECRWCKKFAGNTHFFSGWLFLFV